MQYVISEIQNSCYIHIEWIMEQLQNVTDSSHNSIVHRPIGFRENRFA